MWGIPRNEKLDAGKGTWIQASSRRKKKSATANTEAESGAGERVRTANIHLGKVVLYQLSYARIGKESE